jgi:hypothetical protein
MNITDKNASKNNNYYVEERGFRDYPGTGGTTVNSARYG